MRYGNAHPGPYQAGIEDRRCRVDMAQIVHFHPFPEMVPPQACARILPRDLRREGKRGGGDGVRICIMSNEEELGPGIRIQARPWCDDMCSSYVSPILQVSEA